MDFDWEMLLAGVVAAGLAWVIAWAVCRHARNLALLHAPNDRSSHVDPTPHGGGLGIVVAGLLAAAWLGMMDSATGLKVMGLSMTIALLGLWDDMHPLAAAPRLLVQTLACGAAAAWLGDASGMAELLLILIAGVWWVNLFNFMDGIDGLAAAQALFMLIAGALLAASFAPESAQLVTWRWMWLLAAATGGFLLHNWPPAKIFMGDVGSTFLGFVLFALALVSHREGWMPFSAWMILGALFVVDATITLLTRVYRGERWYEAHRSHVYQQLARKWGAHLPVTLLATAINLGCLAPLAYLVMVRPDLSWLGLVLAYGPLTLGMLALNEKS
jgi:Fuc2NAc and GlcNAc transferase